MHRVADIQDLVGVAIESLQRRPHDAGIGLRDSEDGAVDDGRGSRQLARSELAGIRYKPDTLPDAAWGCATLYDPLELLVR